MKNRMALVAAAVTIALMVTGIAWAAQDSAATTSISLADNQQVEIPVNNAGVVILTQSGGQLRIVSANPRVGYTSEIELAVGREVEADFRGNGERIQFNAELEDGSVRIRIRTDADANSGSTSTSGATASTGATSTTDVTAPNGSTSTTDVTAGNGSTSTTAGNGSSSTTVTTGTSGSGLNGSSTLVLSDGQVSQVQIADAGSVLLRRNGSSLTVVSTQANAGWAVEVEVSSGREVEGDFRNGNRRVQFNFELEDGVIRVRIESDGSSSGSTSSTSTTNTTSGNTSTTSGGTSTTNTTNTTNTTAGSTVPNGSVTYNLDGAGTVTVVFSGGSMSIGSINPAAGWTIEKSEQKSDEVRVELTNGDDEAELRVRIDNGQVRVEIERKS